MLISHETKYVLLNQNLREKIARRIVEIVILRHLCSNFDQFYGIFLYFLIIIIEYNIFYENFRLFRF